jgi:hypothetical protein
MTKKPRRGDKLEIKARDYRDLIYMLQEYRTRSSVYGSGGYPTAPTVRRGFNATGSGVSIGEVLGIESLAAVDTSWTDVQKTAPQFKFRTPTSDDVDNSNLAIALSPALDGGMVVVATAGMVYAGVDVLDAGHSFATAEAASTQLISSDSGPFRIVDAESGTGVKAACVAFQVGAGSTGIIPLTLVLASPSGSGGGVGTEASWLYDVTHAVTGETLGEDIDPTDSPHKHTRPPEGKLISATTGIGYYDSVGTFTILRVFEFPDPSEC